MSRVQICIIPKNPNVLAEIQASKTFCNLTIINEFLRLCSLPSYLSYLIPSGSFFVTFPWMGPHWWVSLFALVQRKDDGLGFGERAGLFTKFSSITSHFKLAFEVFIV